MTAPRPFISLTLDSLAENLALDELLVVSAEEGKSGEILRFWEWQNYAVVLGAGCKIADDVDEQRCQADGVPILRRSSGGGTVLLGPGCLCYTLVLELESQPALQAIRSSYAWILARICEALSSLHSEIHQAGISDLAIGDRKFSGSAQQRKRRYLLHHGTLLYDFDLGRVGRCLRLPARRPEYREARAHEDFLINFPGNAAEIGRLLQTAWQATEPAPTLPLDQAAALARDKYLSDDWTSRR
ncbi:MAG TPA: lipoate--protein ligase family protein [Gemmataceae bacterium]|nr:lipoate--protein ligase family protein [Gemmataceae bacterium]